MKEPARKICYTIHDKPAGYIGEWYSRFTTRTLGEARIIADQRKSAGSRVKIVRHSAAK